MVEHPLPVDFDENSSDLELTIDVTDEPMPAVPNGVISKKCHKFESLSTIDDNTTDTLDNDLSINSRIIETVIEEEDSGEGESTSCDSVSRFSSKTTKLKKSDNCKDNRTEGCGMQNHVSSSSAKVNGFSSKRNSFDDTSEGEVDSKESKTKSVLKKLLGDSWLNDFRRPESEITDKPAVGQESVSEEIGESLADLPIDSCDKSNNSSTKCRVNGDIPKSHDGSVSPALVKRKLDANSGDSDSRSGNSSPCPEKRLKIVDSENGSKLLQHLLQIDDSKSSSSCLEKPVEIENSVVPNGYTVNENSINSVAQYRCRAKKKTTARKSTGGIAPKMITHILDEGCSKELLADAKSLVLPTENGSKELLSNGEDLVTPVENGSEKLADGKDLVTSIENGCEKLADGKDLVTSLKNGSIELSDGEDLVTSIENGSEKLADGTDLVTPLENGSIELSDGEDLVTPIENGSKKLPDDIDLITPLENGVDHSTTNFVDADTQSNEVHQSSIDDKNYPIKFTRESVSDESVKSVFKKMVKRMTRRQLEEIVLQKFCEMISESGEIGELKKQTAEAEETEVFRKKKEVSIEKQIHQLRITSEVFCTQARLAKERGQIIIPKVVTRSVALQVSMPSASEPSSPSTGATSVDDGFQKAPSTATNSRIISSDAGQSSGCSSPTKSPRPSTSEMKHTANGRKPSLPTDDSSAAKNKCNAPLPAKKNSAAPAKLPPATSDDAIVDLTDLDDTSDSPPRPLPIASRNGLSITRLRRQPELLVSAKHPAPLPPTPKIRQVPGAKLPPPKPNLSIQKNNSAIQMTWDLHLTEDHEPIEKYEIFAYQETANVPASVTLWKFVGAVDSLALPMACTLTQFVNHYTYHFAVRAIDKLGRHGAFSCAGSVAL